MHDQERQQIEDRRRSGCASTEEPGAVVPHAGICEGGHRATGVPTSIGKNIRDTTMQGRMPFPFPFLPMLIVTLLISAIIPTLLRLCRPHKQEVRSRAPSLPIEGTTLDPFADLPGAAAAAPATKQVQIKTKFVECGSRTEELSFDSANDIHMKIRLAKQEDAPGIAAVVHAMDELHSVAQQSIETTTKTVSSNLERVSASGFSAAYIAEDSQGEIVGYGAVHWTPFLFLPGGEAYVTELFVRPEDSGKGAGSGILETIVAEAKQRGCSRVTLLNGRDGESYRRSFYTKRGWVERDHMANFILPLIKEQTGRRSRIG